MQTLMQCFVFSLFLCAVNSAKILGVFHMAAYSHYQLGDRLLQELATRGHEVTVITPFAEKNPLKNFKQIVLTGAIERGEPIKAKLFENTETPFARAFTLQAWGLELVNYTLGHPNVQKFLKSKQEFDLVILYQFESDGLRGLCYYYKAPCIVLTAVAAPYWTHLQIANPDSPAYIPDLYLDPAYDTTFIQRFFSSFLYIGLRLFVYLYALPRQNEVMQKYFPDAPHLKELYYNTSLVLVNSHVSMHSATPYLPNIINIGGFHLKPPKKLPKDLQEYLDNAKDGVVLFSLGSNLKSKYMPKEKKESILKAFSKLKQKVLCKWEEEEPNQPPNVKLDKWLPQSDLMAHPNVKLLITHGGHLSTTEAIYHGVPIIGISVFGDQEHNIALAERSGYAILVRYRELTEERLSNALNEILNNPKYRENIKKRSEIMHDVPIKQLDNAVFWVEYVIRHKGAQHLRSAALNLYWYQYLLLDVVAAVVVFIFVPLYVIIKLLTRCCRKSKKSLEKISKEKKVN